MTLSEFREPVVSALMDAFVDESETVRRNAYYALNAIGAPAVDPLIELLGSIYNSQIRETAAEALGDIGQSRTNRSAGIGKSVGR